MTIEITRVSDDGIGTTRLEVTGVEQLRPLDVGVIPDRIEVGTFLAGAALLRSKIRVEGVRPEHVASTIDALSMTGEPQESYDWRPRFEPTCRRYGAPWGERQRAFTPDARSRTSS